MPTCKIKLFVNGVGAPISLRVSSTNTESSITNAIAIASGKSAGSFILYEHNDPDKAVIPVGNDLGPDGAEFDVVDAGECALVGRHSGGWLAWSVLECNWTCNNMHNQDIPSP